MCARAHARRQKWQPKKFLKMLLVSYMPLARKIASKKPSNRAVRGQGIDFRKPVLRPRLLLARKASKACIACLASRLAATLTAALVPFASIECMRPWLDTNTHKVVGNNKAS